MEIRLETLIQVLKIVASVSIFFVWFIRYDNIKKEFIDYGMPDWFRDLVGIFKISFAFMIHSANKQIVLIGAVGISFLMFGAVLTHLRMKSSFRKYIASVIMLIISFLLFISIYSNPI
tara:strand:+ start:77 stop:430 length:354 start_codon:yes stop_codon:yes gene_type:complete